MTKERETEKENKKKEEVHEIFEIEKDGSEKIIETKGIIKEDIIRKGDVTKENNILKGVLIIIGIILLITVVSFFILKPSSQFKYEGLEFVTIQEGELTFYQTSFNVADKGKPATYNIYFRNDPRKLEKNVPFNGILNLENFMVLNSTTENLFCGGNWSLALGNMQNLKIFNIDVMRDENASCSSTGEYMFVQIEEGNETRIEQYGPSCYKLIVNNCEILPVMERFMVENLVKLKAELNKQS